MESDDLNIPQIKPEVPEGKEQQIEVEPARRNWKRLAISAFVLMAVFLIVLILPLFLIYRDARSVIASAQALESAVKDDQDITKVKGTVAELRGRLQKLQGTQKLLIWTRFLPLLGGYYRDGEAVIKAGIAGSEAADLIILAIEPYADIIGFTSEGNKAVSGEESANDRIEFIVASIKEIVPKLDDISLKVTEVQKEIGEINPSRYPVRIGNQEVRSKIVRGISLIDEAAGAIKGSRPLLEEAAYFLGIDEERTYLLLFQNDKELRPTGGFITAYTIMTVNKGKVNPVLSTDIYNLDLRYRPTAPAPQPIIDYIAGPYTIDKGLRLRDMNWSPDFEVAMDLFSSEAKKAGIPRVDGIVAVDTHVVVNILAVLGQIGVPGFGNFSTAVDERCNCPQVIYELESFADNVGPVVWSQTEPDKIVFAPRGFGNRKEIVGPLMNSILSNALGQPQEKLPALFEAGWKSLTEKHVLFYMFDKDKQEAVKAFNIAGKLNDFEGDYLHINDANLGGRKSNLYVTQEVAQNVEVAKDGTITKTLEITYKNPQGYDGWLNSVLPNWTRIYIPKGSEVVDVSGFEERAEVYDELGKTVIAGGFELRPQGVVKISLVYKLPFKIDKKYSLFIQKQPGKDLPLYTINYGRQTEEFFLKTDRELNFN